MGYNFVATHLIAVLLCLTSVYGARKLPPYITYCHQNDPEINQCFKNVVDQIRPHLSKGIPEFKIPSLNPLIIPEASLNNGDRFKASFKNIEIYHLDEFQLTDIVTDLPKNHFEMSMAFPRLRIKSTYVISGRILVLQLDGRGPADGNFTDVSGRLIIDGSRYIKDGKEYIKFDQKSLTMNLGKPFFQFDNIFRDNRELNEQTNKVVNENIVDIIDELKPVIEQTVIQVIIGFVERVFTRFSVDELFPKS